VTLGKGLEACPVALTVIMAQIKPGFNFCINS